MSDFHGPQGPFDIPDVPDWVPRRLKPWIFILFVVIVQFSGGVYLAAVTDMVGTSALMQEDVLMAGYAQLVGMSINFAVMFRLKFRFSARIGMLACGAVLLAANIICASSTNMVVLVATCFVAGWFRMWATFICNSTIQLWLTPKRDMAIFFCYVYLLVDGAIQLSGIVTVYTSFYHNWEHMHALMSALLILMMILVVIFVKPFKGMMRIPLLGIDWIGSILWSCFMLCFTFICVYGNHYDWFEAEEIRAAAIFGAVCVAINLWRATFLHHPYISIPALTNRNVVRAILVYLVFFTIMATEHVFEHSYAIHILGFVETNLIDLNWYVMVGIVVGIALCYFGFALRHWSYKTMTALGFAFACGYLAYFYFMIDYGVEKEMLFLPLFLRGAGSVIISTVYLTSIVQSGLHFFVFPQALTVNGFAGAVMGATLGPAIIGEWLSHSVARNASELAMAMTATNQQAAHIPASQLFGIIQGQALLESMKEIYGWLLIVGLVSLAFILLLYTPIRPNAIFPKWRTIRRVMKSMVRSAGYSSDAVKA
ncbi:MAG: hypothetical protein K2L83_07960 [Muribaculaceae bacterium]|nr:hypothetical protein [Muribaculaceae bacterium]